MTKQNKNQRKINEKKNDCKQVQVCKHFFQNNKDINSMRWPSHRFLFVYDVYILHFVRVSKKNIRQHHSSRIRPCEFNTDFLILTLKVPVNTPFTLTARYWEANTDPQNCLNVRI